MKVIGIKRLWYGAALTAVPTKATLRNLLADAKELKNTHGDTWNYEQSDPEVETAVNGLTGKTYVRVKNSEGEKKMSWTSGEYELADKIALQGGKELETANSGTGGVWEAPMTLDIIEKALYAYTQSGDIVVFTQASVTAKADKQGKVLGLGVVGTALDNAASTAAKPIADEYWFEGAKLDAALQTLLKQNTAITKS